MRGSALFSCALLTQRFKEGVRPCILYKRYVQLFVRDRFIRGENRMILTPEIVFRKIECIHPDYLKAHGITALVLDVDNTLTGDNSQVLEPTVQAWLD